MNVEGGGGGRCDLPCTCRGSGAEGQGQVVISELPLPSNTVS
jgi:hypothetical protein